MIQKSIITAVLLFVVYETFLRVADIRWDTSQSDKSANIISAQDYIFNYSAKQIAADTVILGTSVSRKLITDSLGKGYINLAFNAWSSYDGLELLTLSKKFPACALIETNYVKNQILQPEISDNLEPLPYYAGKWFKSFQVENQPVGLVIGWGKSLMKGRIEKMKVMKRSNKNLYNSNIEANLKIMDQLIPDSVLNARFIKLKSLIEGLKQENVRIIFYEVPFDEKLEEAGSLKEIRKYFSNYFPPSQYTYLPNPAVNNYVFSDGVHLAAQSALDYTVYMKEKLNQLRGQ